MKGVVGISTWLVALMAVVACGDPGKKEKTVEFRILNGPEIESLDPHRGSSSNTSRVKKALFEGLTGSDEDEGVVPGVAERWEVSRDGTRYTLFLRKSTWSDGVPITAQTVYDSWIRAMAPETASRYTYEYEQTIAGAEAYLAGKGSKEDLGFRVIDDYTFQVDLAGPIPDFEDRVGTQAFAPVPLHVIEKYGDTWTDKETIVSSGPFLLEEWIPQKQISVIPNPTYWDANRVKLDRVIFLTTEDTNTAYQVYISGEADWLPTPPTGMIDEIKGRPDYQPAVEQGTYFYGLNVKVPPLDDVRVRRALALSIDRDAITEKITKAGEIPAYSFVAPSTKNHPPVRGILKHDVKEAQRLLAEAGFPGGEGFPKLQVLFNIMEKHKQIAEFIQSEWKNNLGILVKLDNLEWKIFLDAIRQGDFQIARNKWSGGGNYPDGFLQIFTSTAPQNFPRWHRPAYDKLVAEALSLPDGPARREVWVQAERLLLEEVPLIPIYHSVNKSMISPKWKGWVPNSADSHPLKYIHLDEEAS